MSVDVEVTSITVVSGRLAVAYVVYNHPSSPEKLWRFTVEAPVPVSSIRRPDPQTQWRTATYLGYETRVSVAKWSALGQYVAPGSKTPELRYEAPGLPGIVTYWAGGYFPVTPIDEGPTVMPKRPIKEVLAQEAVVGRTVGVVPFPEELSSASLLERLDGLRAEACGELKWIRSARVCSTLGTALGAARQAAERGDTAAVRAHLTSFVAELEGRHGEGELLNNSAYWLLKVNAEFILGRLE